MSHIPYGYEVKDGKIFIVEEAADKVRQIFQNYVSGMSLTESAKTAECCQDSKTEKTPVCPLTNRRKMRIIKLERAYR